MDIASTRADATRDGRQCGVQTQKRIIKAMSQMTLGNPQNTTEWAGPKDDNWPLVASRAAGLNRLMAFAGKAGRAYQTHRNTDRGEGRHNHVSVLSPYLRHRMVDETEVLRQILDQHTPNEAFKFVQEVFWRSYWKGWLEHRSLLWPTYQRELPNCLDQLKANPRGLEAYQRAIAGETTIALFNEWCDELKQTGYLHNHARMWFASIWVFTLRLPWELGADFFVRQLLDGDPASNTLGWRWVAGLHTVGKTYLATPKNIRTCAEERLAGRSDQELGLHHLTSKTVTVVERLPAKALQKTEIPWPAPVENVCSEYRCNHGRTTLLVTEEDLTWLPSVAPEGVVVLSPSSRSTLEASSALVEQFVSSALKDARQRMADHWAQAPVLMAPHILGDDALVDWLVEQQMDEVICAYLPVGPTRARVERLRGRLAGKGIALRMQMRDYDRLVWPHASKGFFQLGKRIPEFLAVMHLNEQA